MNTYSPADDTPPPYEPDYDGEHFTEPDDIDYEAYDAWVATQPFQVVRHACGHVQRYALAPWIKVSVEELCGECRVEDLPAYDDPFTD